MPMTPGTGPAAVITVTRWPTSTAGSQVPISATNSTPEESTCLTTRPISSMWPTSATRGPPPALTVAKELPSASPRTSANSAAASRQTSAAGRS